MHESRGICEHVILLSYCTVVREEVPGCSSGLQNSVDEKNICNVE